MTPLMPPSTKTIRNPIVNSTGGSHRIPRPVQIAATNANTMIAVGIVIMKLAELKNCSTRFGIPVVNMWWTQRAKLTIPMAMKDAITSQRAGSRRLVAAGSTLARMPSAGSSWM
jgi:hypothetical protein